MKPVIITIVIALAIISSNSMDYSGYAPPSASMENIDSVKDLKAQYALRRINQYREASGLKPWVYDASLSKMAQSHAHYMVINCKAGRGYGGHYENPSYPGYTKEGDEAARTSGLSGGSDILYAYESLMAAVYHRVQFTRPGKRRVGYGFAKSSDNRCSGGLFVTRPSYSSWTYGKPRFILFPPNGFKEAHGHFSREWPDPIPLKPHGKTGYIISILMHYRDVQQFVSSSAEVFDERGRSLDLWVTDPANPSVKRINTSGKYAPDKKVGSNPFAKNFNMVFIIPKKPLTPGMKYRVKARLTFKDSYEDLSWWFSVKENSIWTVKKNHSRPENNLRFILTHALPMDRVLIPSGTLLMQKGTFWISKSLIFQGNNSLLKNRTNSRSIFAVHKTTSLILKNITIDSSNQMFYAKDNAVIHFKNCKIINSSRNNYFASLSDNAKMIFSHCDFRDFSGPWFIYTRNKNTSVLFQGNNKGSLTSLKGHSRGKGLITIK